MDIDFQPDSKAIDFQPEGDVQKLNKTFEPTISPLPHSKLYYDIRLSKPVMALLGPPGDVVTQAGSIKGALPNLTQITYGNVNPDASKNIGGVLNFSPASLMPTPTNEVEGINKALLSQVNVQNLLLGKGLGMLMAAPISAGVNLLKAATGTALATQGAESVGSALGGRTSGVPLTPEQKGSADVNAALGALMLLAPTTLAHGEVGPELKGVNIDKLLDPNRNRYVSGEMQQGTREFPFTAPAPSPRFNIDAQGNVVDTNVRATDPIPEPLRSDTIRPAQQEPVVIDFKPESSTVLTPEMLSQSPTSITPASAFTKYPVGDVGGQISFRGEGVPSAMQSREIPAPPQNLTKEQIGQELNLKPHQWPPEFGGAQGYTDKTTGMSIEGVQPGTPGSVVESRMQAKLNPLSQDLGVKERKVGGKTYDIGEGGDIQYGKEKENEGVGTSRQPTQLLSEQTKSSQEAAQPIEGLGPEIKLNSGVPIFDPDLWGMDKNKVNELKEKYNKKILEAGSTAATEITKAARKSAVVNAPTAQAILNNPNARKFETLGKKFAQPGEELSILDSAKNAITPLANKLSEGDKVVNPWDVIFDWMDGGQAKFKGPLVQQIRIPFDDKFNAEGNMHEVLSAPLKKIVKDNNLTPKNEQRIAVYLHSLQEGGRERMIESGVRPDVIDNIVKTLSPAERSYADAWRKIDDQLYPELRDVALKADGVKVRQVANHFPWMRDFDKYTPDVDEIATNPNLKKGSEVDPGDVLWPGLPLELDARKTPGSIITRKPGSKSPIRFDTFAIADRYIRDAAHYISSRELVKDTGRLVASDEFADRYGDLGQKLMTEFLNTYARQGRYKKNIWIDTVKRNLGRAIIGGRIPSQVMHTANIPFAIQQAGPVWWEKGLQETLSDEGQDFINKHFNETKSRGGGEPVQSEIAQQSARTMLGKRFNDLSRWSFAVQREVDRLNSQATTMGVYMRLLEENGKNPNDYSTIPVDPKLIGEARIRARRAVASPLYKDTPPIIARGGSLGRSFFQFQNVFLDQYSNLRYEGAQVGLPQAMRGSPKQLMTTTAALMAMLMVESGIKYGYKQGVKSLSGNNKKDDDSFTKQLAEESLKRAPGMGQLQSSLLYGGTGIPILDVPLDTAREVKKAMQGDKATRITAGTRAAANASELFGIPGTSQAADIATALERKTLFKSHEQRLQDATGKDPSTMRLQDRIKAEREYKKTEAPMSKDDQARAAERNIANITKRGKEITSELDKPTQKWIKDKGLGDVLPGYDNKLKVGGESLYLTEKETERLGELVKGEYEKTIKQLQTQKSNITKDVFNEQLTFARNRARALMMKEIKEGSGSKNEQDNENKKQFSIIPRN